MTRAEEVIRESEKSKARVHGLSGKDSYDINMIDIDYQMIDAHVDEGLCRKILNFEYVDLSRLLAKNKGNREEDHRLEFVTKNGATFLSPVADHESSVAISNYTKWEQAFGFS